MKRRQPKQRRGLTRGATRLALGASIFLLASGWLLLASALAEDAVAVRAALDSITAGELKTYVNTLADDALQGREAGSQGGRAAGNYLAERLGELGLRGAGDDGGYFQSFGAGYRNVLALVEGGDPQLKQQYVIVGAHYDHVGYGTRRNSFGPVGQIHNGADDNASGTAALLEVAEALATLQEPPRRSILLALWDAEEKGMLGSEHWIRTTSIPPDQMVLAINLDMVGRLRNELLHVYGSRTARGLRRLVSFQNREFQLDLDFTWEMKANADHHTFFSHGVPVIMLHTGLHSDYHRPSDDADKINSLGMQEVARLTLDIALEMAERRGGAEFRSASRGETESGRRRLERPLEPLPPRLGVTWRKKVATENGLLLSRIVAGSPAERAGLQAGDRLLKLNGREIGDEEQFRSDILAAREDVVITAERLGQSDPFDVTAELAGSPLRLGVSWRSDDAAPGAIVLSRVVPGSPAHQAGLRVGDRVYEVADRDFQDGAEFQQLARTLPSPLELLVERRGRLRRAALELPPVEDAEKADSTGGEEQDEDVAGP